MAWTPFTRRHHDKSRMCYASDVTDREWSLIASFMPRQPRLGRRRKTSLRAVMDGNHPARAAVLMISAHLP